MMKKKQDKRQKQNEMLGRGRSESPPLKIVVSNRPVNNPKSKNAKCDAICLKPLY